MGFGPLTTTPGLRAGSSITRRSNAFGAKKGYGCRSGDGANAAAVPPRRPPWSPMRPTGCGRWTSSWIPITDGRPIKIVSIVDEHTRECLGGRVERSITGEHLMNELDRLAAERGTYPAVLRCDNGPELACSAMADWAAIRSGCTSFRRASRGATATSNRSTPASATSA